MLYFITEGNFIRIKDGDNDFRLLHKTSNCINWTVTDKIDLSIDEVTFDELSPSELTFDGVAASTTDGVINSLKGMFTGLQAAKVYRALLTQSGTDAPVATVLENTIGTITYDYDSAGSYGLNSSALFTSGKTFVMGGGSSNNASTYVYLGEINSTSRIVIRARDLEGTFSDDIMANTPIEILVYP
jgi:hypothetical protein